MVSKECGFEKRLERLVNAIVKGSVVPFLGAGFSSDAKSDIDPDFLPRVSWLNEKLKTYISLKYSSLNPITKESQQIANLFGRAKSQNLLGELAEIAQRLSNHPDEVLKAIKIEKFNTLRPSKAHRFLAYLVREGLINEVITTNYDPCIEDAYRESFGDIYPIQISGKKDLENQITALDPQFEYCSHCYFCETEKGKKDFSDFCLKTRNKNCEVFGVVHDLYTYREYGAKIVSNDEQQYPFLKIYKINGCIRDYYNSLFCMKLKRNEYKTRILLTERELQKFGTEAWARDLLKDRARSRSLLFIGFGSEEPQVRHNVLALMDEFKNNNFSSKNNKFEKNSEEILSLPNTPFMSVYEKNLSFSQMQIMSGFVESHFDEDKDIPDYKEKLELSLGNCFTGHDAENHISPGKENLSADDFMEYIFAEVFKSLIIKYSLEKSPFLKWLGEYTDYVDLWKDNLINFVNGKEIKSKNTLNFEGLLKFTDVDESRDEKVKGRRFLLISKYFYYMKFDATHLAGHEDFYISLKEDSLFILFFLTIYASFLKEKKGKIEFDQLLGTAFTFDTDQKIYLSYKTKEMKNIIGNKSDGEAATKDTQLLKIIDFPSLTESKNYGRVYSFKDKKEKTIEIKRYIRVPASELIEKSKKPENIENALNEIFDESLRKRKKSRPIVKEL